MHLAGPPCVTVRIRSHENAAANAALLHIYAMCFRTARQCYALNFLQLEITHTEMEEYPYAAWGARNSSCQGGGVVRRLVLLHPSYYSLHVVATSQ